MAGPPDMTSEQALMAVEVLSISGSFINIGSAKAFQHNLRKLTKSELSEVLEKMTLPASSKYCVGLLCTEGASRVFYKIPPPLIKEEALNFYSMDLSVYSNLYYGPVRVPHNVKEPYEWRCMLEMKSPFNLMTIDSSAFQWSGCSEMRTLVVHLMLSTSGQHHLLLRFFLPLPQCLGLLLEFILAYHLLWYSLKSEYLCMWAFWFFDLLPGRRKLFTEISWDCFITSVICSLDLFIPCY